MKTSVQRFPKCFYIGMLVFSLGHIIGHISTGSFQMLSEFLKGAGAGIIFLAVILVFSGKSKRSQQIIQSKQRFLHRS